jgi:hypothetical protein
VREVQLERRPVGMTIVDGAFNVAFDGEQQLWTADRNNHAIVSFTLVDVARKT